jgi:D,D-heptose 1,7-bisphosphate phosphatase
MAGGKGTRMASFAPCFPKPMIPIHGKPILHHQLDCLVKNNLNDILIVTGYLGYVIKDYFGDGTNFGCSVTYFNETEPLGSGGALYKIFDKINDDFILINGDIIFDIDFSRFISFYKSKNAWAALTAHPNSHPYDSALLFTDKDHRVVNWLNKEEPRYYYKNQVNAGIHILSKNLLRAVKPSSEKADLDREILKPFISSGKIFAYSTPEYIKDAGTPDRFARVSLDIENGLVRQRNLSMKQKAIFLDRDGTLNKIRGFINKPEDFELLNGVPEAICKINQSGFLAIVITNQPVIARGECSVEELDTIHQKMETDLGKKGSFIDDLFFCPHHPDRGFPDERLEYKIDCDCRKPKPGMILRAAEKYNIDLACSYMVGDNIRDVETGIAAGCIPILLTEKNENKQSIHHFSSLNEFVKSCL